MFYVYVDYTKESPPRPFYVGKGNESRVANLKRNRKHTSIKNKYGIERKIVLETLNEQEAFDKEINLIKELNTQKGIGCNMTSGGEGIKGHNEVKIIGESKELTLNFNSMREVAKYFNLHHTTISNIFAHRQSMPEPMLKFEWKISNTRTKNKSHKNSIPVLKIDPDTDKTVTCFKIF